MQRECETIVKGLKLIAKESKIRFGCKTFFRRLYIISCLKKKKGQQSWYFSSTDFLQKSVLQPFSHFPSLSLFAVYGREIIFVISPKFSQLCSAKFCPIRYSFCKGFNSSWSYWQLGYLLTGCAKFASLISLIPYLRYASLYLEHATFNQDTYLCSRLMVVLTL